jgi:hypothetical protein
MLDTPRLRSLALAILLPQITLSADTYVAGFLIFFTFSLKITFLVRLAPTTQFGISTSSV